MKRSFLLTMIVGALVLVLEGSALGDVGAQAVAPQILLEVPFWSEDFSGPLQTGEYYIIATDGSGIRTAGNEFLLTESNTGERGRIFNPAPAWMDKFVANFKINLGLYADGSPVADGAAFIFCPSYDYAPSAGPFLDASCPGGYIVAFDTYEVLSERLYVAFENTDNRVCVSNKLVPGFFADGEWHDISITFDNGSMTISVDGRTPWPCILPGYQPFRGYFGFSASTGGYYADQLVDDISIDASLLRIYLPLISR